LTGLGVNSAYLTGALPTDKKTHLTDHEVADAALHPMAGMVVTPIIHKKINCIQQLIIIINAS